MRNGMIFGIATSLLWGSAAAGPEQVAFPDNYREQFVKYWEGDRASPNDTQTGVAFANETALRSAADGAPLDHGSVIVFEVWKAKLDDAGSPVMGPDGRRVPETLALIAVMEKRQGFGADVPEQIRNDDWQFAAFKPDGTLVERDYAPCFECHKPLEASDYLYTFEALAAAK